MQPASVQGYGGRRSVRATLLFAAGLIALEAGAIAALSVVNSAGMSFGAFAAGNGGAVTVSPGGVRTASGSVALISSSSSSPAQLSVTGEPGATYAIELPRDPVVLTSPAGPTMVVSGFVSTPNGASQLGVGGSQLISVGATLNVAAGQAPGSYAGSFQVSVSYN